MSKRKRFLIGGCVILAAISYLIVGGMKEAMVYFKMPSELRAEESSMQGKFVSMRGMYVKGVPPYLFTEGKGAVVEGRIGSDGVFQATTIMAKHAEEYTPRSDTHPA